MQRKVLFTCLLGMFSCALYPLDPVQSPVGEIGNNAPYGDDEAIKEMLAPYVRIIGAAEEVTRSQELKKSTSEITKNLMQLSHNCDGALKIFFTELGKKLSLNDRLIVEDIAGELKELLLLRLHGENELAGETGDQMVHEEIMRDHLERLAACNDRLEQKLVPFVFLMSDSNPAKVVSRVTTQKTVQLLDNIIDTLRQEKK